MHWSMQQLEMYIAFIIALWNCTWKCKLCSPSAAQLNLPRVLNKKHFSLYDVEEIISSHFCYQSDEYALTSS
jgi:hypothetical protein